MLSLTNRPIVCLLSTALAFDLVNLTLAAPIPADNHHGHDDPNFHHGWNPYCTGNTPSPRLADTMYTFNAGPNVVFSQYGQHAAPQQHSPQAWTPPIYRAESPIRPLSPDMANLVKEWHSESQWTAPCAPPKNLSPPKQHQIWANPAQQRGAASTSYIQPLAHDGTFYFASQQPEASYTNPFTQTGHSRSPQGQVQQQQGSHPGPSNAVLHHSAQQMEHVLPTQHDAPTLSPGPPAKHQQHMSNAAAKQHIPSFGTQLVNGKDVTALSQKERLAGIRQYDETYRRRKDALLAMKPARKDGKKPRVQVDFPVEFYRTWHEMCKAAFKVDENSLTLEQRRWYYGNGILHKRRYKLKE